MKNVFKVDPKEKINLQSIIKNKPSDCTVIEFEFTENGLFKRTEQLEIIENKWKLLSFNIHVFPRKFCLNYLNKYCFRPRSTKFRKRPKMILTLYKYK